MLIKIISFKEVSELTVGLYCKLMCLQIKSKSTKFSYILILKCIYIIHKPPIIVFNITSTQNRVNIYSNINMTEYNFDLVDFLRK